jgi:NAD(P)-dependent dehydrogenase (short-subunit alcohol dehydrogenase family)
MGYALSGKIALVTGANRGIGEALVDALVAAGVTKVYAAARSVSALDPLLARHGSRVVPLQLDVTDATQIATAAATATDIDLLVNNAGMVGFFGGDFTDPKWIEGGRQEMEVNFLGTFAVTQAFAPVLAKNGGGAVANLNSVASFVSFPILAAYSASKAATHSLTQVTRAMLRGHHTQVFGTSAICARSHFCSANSWTSQPWGCWCSAHLPSDVRSTCRGCRVEHEHPRQS